MDIMAIAPESRRYGSLVRRTRPYPPTRDGLANYSQDPYLSRIAPADLLAGRRAGAEA
jgi:hypothetical protein